LAQSAASGAPSSPRLVAWTDPTEHAFTVNVPRGWRITGGTHRNSPTDARSYVSAESPDGKIKVWIDDPNILPRRVAHPAYYPLGWYEGRVVQSAAGPLLIEGFKTGARVAQEFVARRVCGTSRALSAFDLPIETQRMSAAIAPAAARAGVQASPSAGEFVYRCGERFGYAYAVTVLASTTPQGPQSWAVYKLAGYLSDKSDVATARLVMNAMRASFAIDHAWEARYEQQIHDRTGALMEISNRLTQESIRHARQSLEQNIALVARREREFDRMREGSMGSFRRRQESQDRVSQRWSDVTLGKIHGCDDLGNCTEVYNDYQYYWTKDGRTVVGGPSDGSIPNHDLQYHRWTPDY
jgi:hypothetical protein